MKRILLFLLLGLLMVSCRQGNTGSDARGGETGNEVASEGDTSRMALERDTTGDNLPDMAEAPDAAKETAVEDEVEADDDDWRQGEQLVCALSKGVHAGRQFVVVPGEDFYILCSKERKGQMRKISLRHPDEEENMAEYMEYYCFPSPDERYLFAVVNPSKAGRCDIFYKWHVYRINTSTLSVKHIVDCGALKLTDSGFRVAVQTKWLNPDASCAEARFKAKHVDYDFSGKLLREGKEMADEKIAADYQKNMAEAEVGCSLVVMKKGRSVSSL